MKKIIIYIFCMFFILYGCGDEVKQPPPQVCTSIYLTTSVEPSSCGPNGTLITVTVKACWNGDEPTSCEVSVYRVSPQPECLSHRVSTNALYRNITYVFSFHTSEFQYTNCTGQGYNYKIEIVTVGETRPHDFNWNSTFFHSGSKC